MKEKGAGYSHGKTSRRKRKVRCHRGVRGKNLADGVFGERQNRKKGRTGGKRFHSYLFLG